MVERENVVKLWEKVEKKLDEELEEIRSKGNKLIPETRLEDILSKGGNLPEEVVEQVRKRGVLIVRNTIPKDEAEKMLEDLINYITVNNGFPKDPKKVSAI
jgi:hypothetical protein